MFSQSYDPLGFDRSLYHGNTHSPRAYEKRKKQEYFRRQRLIQDEPRRRAEVEHIMIRMEEKEKEMRQWHLEKKEELRHRTLERMLARRNYIDEVDTNTSLSTITTRSSIIRFPPPPIYAPPPPIYASVPQGDLDDDKIQDSSTYPTTILLKSDDGRMASHTTSIHEKKQGQRRRADTDLSTICSEDQNYYGAPESQVKQVNDMETEPNMDIDEDDATSVPPHIIAMEALSDDEEDDDNEDIQPMGPPIWRNQFPVGQWIVLNESFETMVHSNCMKHQHTSNNQRNATWTEIIRT